MLGAGSGAFAAAIDLTLRGFEVAVCSTYGPDVRQRLAAISRGRAVEYSGVFGDGSVELRTSADLTPVSKADLVMVVTLAQGYDYYAKRCGKRLGSRPVFLNPGYLGGSLSFARILREEGLESPGLCESNNLPYICRFTGPTKVTIFRKSKLVMFASFPTRAGDRNLDLARQIYPELVPADNILETGMMNPNIVVHPPGMLLNAGWVESGPPFRFYTEGCTDAVSAVIEAVDEERLAICEALGIRAMAIGDYYRRNGYSESDTSRVRDVLVGSKPNRNILAPTSLDSRYITEDVPYGLVPMSSIGKLCGISTTTTDSLIQLASVTMGKAYARTGMTSRRMGIEGLGADGLGRFVRTGSR